MTQAVKKAPAAPKPKKRGKAASLDRKKARAGWFFIAPFVLVFFLVYVPIIYDSINYSFHTIYLLSGGGFELDPVGWQNYYDALFSDPNFVVTLTGGIQQLVLEVPAIVIFSLFMAVLLNQKMVGRTVFRAIFFIPVILSTGLIDSIDLNTAFTEYSQGGVDSGNAVQGSDSIMSVMDLQNLFAGMKVGHELLEYVVEIVNNVYNIVNRSGVQMLIFLAGLQSISPAIYESCTIDGATAWETFWKITFPMISPLLIVNLIYTIIDFFMKTDNQIMTKINETMVINMDYGFASAMAWIYFAVVIVIIGVASLIVSKGVVGSYE